MTKSHEQLPEIPFELQIEILMKLPVKSLMKFKTVSKLWSSLLCSQYFTDRLLKVSSSSLRMYMWLSFENNKVLLSSSSSHDSDLSSFVVDQDLTILVMEGYKVSHVYRGLMCLVKGPSAQIYNTSTRQLLVLPELIAEDHPKTKNIMYHIGHDPVHNQYKVVCTISVISVPRGDDRTEIWIFLLGGDDSSRWRKISSPFQPHHPPTQGLTINGRIYYIAWVRLHPLVLVSFDISSEKISILQEPENGAFWSNDLIEYSGRVALLRYSYVEDKGVMDLWVMEDEEKSIWSKKTLVLHPSQMCILKGNHLRVKGTTRKGEVIFVPRINNIVKSQSKTLFHVFLYNLQTNLLRKVEIKDTPNCCLTKYWDIVGCNEFNNLMHL